MSKIIIYVKAEDLPRFTRPTLEAIPYEAFKAMSTVRLELDLGEITFTKNGAENLVRWTG